MKTIEIGYYRGNGVELIMGVFEGKLCLLDYLHREKRTMIDKRLQKSLSANYIDTQNPLLAQTQQELDEYFEGRRESFSIPLLRDCEKTT